MRAVSQICSVIVGIDAYTPPLVQHTFGAAHRFHGALKVDPTKHKGKAGRGRLVRGYPRLSLPVNRSSIRSVV